MAQTLQIAHVPAQQPLANGFLYDNIANDAEFHTFTSNIHLCINGPFVHNFIEYPMI